MKRLSLQALESRKLMAADVELVDSTLHIEGTEGNDIAEVYTVDDSVVVKLQSQNADGEPGQATEQTFDAELIDGIIFEAFGGDDLLVNDTDIDSIMRAGGGNDVVMGGGGNDILVAGAGADVVLGGGGNDTLLGGIGDDLVVQAGGTADTTDPADETPSDDTTSPGDSAADDSVDDASDPNASGDETPQGDSDDPSAGGEDDVVVDDAGNGTAAGDAQDSSSTDAESPQDDAGTDAAGDLDAQNNDGGDASEPEDCESVPVSDPVATDADQNIGGNSATQPADDVPATPPVDETPVDETPAAADEPTAEPTADGNSESTDGLTIELETGDNGDAGVAVAQDGQIVVVNDGGPAGEDGSSETGDVPVAEMPVSDAEDSVVETEDPAAETAADAADDEPLATSTGASDADAATDASNDQSVDVLTPPAEDVVTETESDNDVLFGGTGNDWVFGEGGDDTVFGGDSPLSEELLSQLLANRLA